MKRTPSFPPFDVLLVGEDKQMLEIFSISLTRHQIRHEITNTGETALVLLGGNLFPHHIPIVVATGIELGGMYFNQLFEKMMFEHQHTHRLLFTGFVGLEELVNVTHLAHKVFRKTGEPNPFDEIIRHISELIMSRWKIEVAAPVGVAT